MSLSRFLAAAVLVTSLTLVYVRQQVELVKLGYRIEAQRKSFAEVLDHNTFLRYNVVALRSPQNLQRQFLLTGLEEFHIVEGQQVVRVASLKAPRELPPAGGRQETLAVSILQSLKGTFAPYLFGPEAEASTAEWKFAMPKLPRN